MSGSDPQVLTGSMGLDYTSLGFGCWQDDGHAYASQEVCPCSHASPYHFPDATAQEPMSSTSPKLSMYLLASLPE
ncbi:6664_t:CDS:2 [Paraglomus occultum]|uniref:6664_t:CDS:1 n=1 Tax=Paraglomus occultum TaxID=144539 RepID=A0A9N9C0T7_9GLOM|nr:6664_t:CDS:2 [Paraglomus occultum]